MSRRIQIAVANHSTHLSTSQCGAIVAALQKQVTDDFRPTWGSAAELIFYTDPAKMPKKAWWLLMLENSDQAGALGYHDLTSEGNPIGKVFVGDDLKFDASPSVTASHELLEILGDPTINLGAFDPKTGRWYAYESADSVEADQFAYEIDGIKVSDFVLRRFFDPTASGGDFSFKGNVHKPFALAAGGYLSYLDLNDLSKGWQQETAREIGPDENRHMAERQPGFPAGSRRERRTRFGSLVYSKPPETRA